MTTATDTSTEAQPYVDEAVDLLDEQPLSAQETADQLREAGVTFRAAPTGKLDSKGQPVRQIVAIGRAQVRKVDRNERSAHRRAVRAEARRAREAARGAR